MTGAATWTIVSLIEEETSGANTLAACIETDPPCGTLEGAVYRPLELMVPTVEFPPGTLSTDQLTAELNVPEPITVAVSCSVVFVITVPCE